MPIQIQNFTMSWIFSKKKKLKIKSELTHFIRYPQNSPLFQWTHCFKNQPYQPRCLIWTLLF